MHYFISVILPTHIAAWLLILVPGILVRICIIVLLDLPRLLIIVRWSWEVALCWTVRFFSRAWRKIFKFRESGALVISIHCVVLIVMSVTILLILVPLAYIWTSSSSSLSVIESRLVVLVHLYVLPSPFIIRK